MCILCTDPSCQNRFILTVYWIKCVKLFCLTNRKSGNQLWQLGPVQEIYIFLRGHVYFIFEDKVCLFCLFSRRKASGPFILLMRKIRCFSVGNDKQVRFQGGHIAQPPSPPTPNPNLKLLIQYRRPFFLKLILMLMKKMLFLENLKFMNLFKNLHSHLFVLREFFFNLLLLLHSIM